MATPQTASFITPGMGLQPPGQAEAQDLGLEQQMLLQRLMEQAQGMSAPALDGGRFKSVNFEGLGNALAAARTKQELETSRRKALDLQGKYQQGLLAEMTRFKEATQGAKGTVPALLAPSGEEEGWQQPGNPMAYQDFEMSPYPEMRTVAKERGAAAQKLLEKLLERSSVESGARSIAAGGDPRMLQPKPEWGFHNGAVFDTTAREGRATPPVVTPVTQETLAGGTVVNRQAGGGLDAVDKAPKTSITLPGANMVHEAIKQLPEERAKALGAAKQMQTVEHALGALEDGAKTGFGAEWLQNARTAVSLVTGIEMDNAPMARLMKVLSENVIQELGGSLGRNISDADVRMMGRASGDPATDAKALETLLALRAAGAVNTIKLHNDRVATLAEHAENPYGPEGTNRLFAVKAPSFGYSFNTPEAAAAFGSVLGQSSYRAELQKTRAEWAADDAARKAMEAQTGQKYTQKEWWMLRNARGKAKSGAASGQGGGE